MDFSVPPILTWIGCWGATVGAVWFLFDKSEQTLRGPVKQAISSWLRNADPQRIVSDWPRYFRNVFDGVFTDQHRSWRCFKRSCAASATSTLILAVIWLLFRPSDFVYTLSEIDTPSDALAVTLLVPVLGLWNMVIDYLSLLETRTLIGVMERARTSTGLVAILIGDLVATAMIFVAGAYLSFIPVATIALPLAGGGPPEWHEVTDWFSAVGEFLVRGSTFTGALDGYPSLGILMYSTLLTSAWLWAFGISSLAVRIAGRVSAGVRLVTRILDVDEKPIQSIGLVVIAGITVVFLVVPLVR
jgi:hypothetical protein